MICIFCRKYYRIRILELKEGFVMIPFTGKQLQLIQLLMEQSTPIALDEISQLLHAGRRSVYYIVNKNE